MYGKFCFERNKNEIPCPVGTAMDPFRDHLDMATHPVVVVVTMRATCPTNLMAEEVQVTAGGNQMMVHGETQEITLFLISYIRACLEQ
jgi:hypothetical protein